jgi:hypothetical protein
MPISFPHRDDTGHLIDVDYFTPEEVAHRLHVSREVVRRNCFTDRWPHLRVQRRYYMNAEQIGRVLEIMTHDPDTIPNWTPILGVAVDPDDVEGVH